MSVLTFLVDLAKGDLRISSPTFVLVVMSIGAAMLFVRRLARIGRWWLAFWTAVLILLATPLGARLVSAPLVYGFQPIQRSIDARQADVVVVLGGGIRTHEAGGLSIDDLDTSALRVLEAARLYRLLAPRKVIVSGGNTNHVSPVWSEAKALEAALLTLGVPADRIAVEDRSLTTREQAIELRPILESLGARTFVLVTAPTHMRRSMRVFRSQQLAPVPSPSAMFADGEDARWMVPKRDALLVSDSAVYEYAALVYYWARGWIS